MIGSLSELAQILGSSEIVAEIAKDILEVEEELIRQSASEVKLVEQVARHTLRSGGKRLRPACVALAARATGLPYDPKRVHRLGACLEMVHMATLIHDDIIDRSPIRRGMPTASAVFGNTGSILSGDVLLAKSMVILAEDGDLGIIRNVAQAVVEMAEGEVREVETRGDFDLSEDDHLDILHKKTAAFIESCCFVGATLTGAPETVVTALRKFGAADVREARRKRIVKRVFKLLRKLVALRCE
jgi:geranylgeranyl pyrophosphate synthase